MTCIVHLDDLPSSSAAVMDLRQSSVVFAYMIQAPLPLAAFLVFGLQKVSLESLDAVATFANAQY